MSRFSAIERLRRHVRQATVVYSRIGVDNQRTIALTFDDGPSEWTPRILDLLRAHESHATFFLLGAAIAGREPILQRMVAEGHELGNHMYSHADCSQLRDEAVREELLATDQRIKAAVSVEPKLVRPPYGSDAKRVSRIADELGLGLTVLRSVDPEDWKETVPGTIVRQVLAEVSSGSIVCLHDGMPPNNRGSKSRDATVRALDEILPALRQDAYRLVTVSELLA